MALPKLNPRFTETVQKTAGAMAARAAAQRASPKVVRDLSRILQAGNFIGSALGIQTGIGFVDNLLSLSGPAEDRPTPLLGGMTPAQAMEVHQRLNAVQLARKNLWFIRIDDKNPPRVGEGRNTTDSVFNLFAVDVSYGPGALMAEKVQLGATSLDKLTGREAVEMQITTYDDKFGSLKSWFESKCAQAAHDDGTFGLPNDYLVDIEVVHGFPSDALNGAEIAYKSLLRMRPQEVRFELSRRDQAMQELQMTFSQFDPFVRVR